MWKRVRSIAGPHLSKPTAQCQIVWNIPSSPRSSRPLSVLAFESTQHSGKGPKFTVGGPQLTAVHCRRFGRVRLRTPRSR